MITKEEKKVEGYTVYCDGNMKVKIIHYTDGSTKTVVKPILPKTF